MDSGLHPINTHLLLDGVLSESDVLIHVLLGHTGIDQNSNNVLKKILQLLLSYWLIIYEFRKLYHFLELVEFQIKVEDFF